MPPPHHRIRCVRRGAYFRQSGAHHIPLTILQPAFYPIHGQTRNIVRHPPHYNEHPRSTTLRPVLDALAHFEDHGSLQCVSTRQNYHTSTRLRTTALNYAAKRLGSALWSISRARASHSNAYASRIFPSEGESRAAIRRACIARKSQVRTVTAAIDMRIAST